MRYLLIIILIDFVFIINAEIPDIKQLWKKHDYSSSVKIEEKKENSRSKLDSASELVKKGEYEKALKIYEKLLNKNTRSSHIHTAIGYCFEKMGQIDNAIAFYTKATVLTPVDPNSLNNLAYLTAQRAATPDEVFPAIKLIDTALKYSRGNLKFNQTKLYILKKAGLMDEWEDLALDILKRNPNINSINIALGEFYAENKNNAQARLFLNRALPEKKAQKLLASLPEQVDESGSTKEKESKMRQEIKGDSVSIDDGMSQDFKEFQKDYLVSINENNGKSDDSTEIIEETSESMVNESPASPDLVRLRVDYEDSFDAGINAYNNGNYERAMESLQDFINISKRNKEFSGKLLRAMKYKGLILTKHGEDSKEIWEEIEFIEKCSFVDKAKRLKQSGSLESLRKHLLSGLNNNNLTEYRDIISQSLTVLEGYKDNKEDIERFYDVEFKIPQKIKEVFPAKTTEYFTQGYRNLIEKKYTACEKYFKLSVNNSPSYFPGYYNLSVLSIKDSRLIDALSFIERAERYCSFDESFFKDIRELYNALNLYML